MTHSQFNAEVLLNLGFVDIGYLRIIHARGAIQVPR